MSEALAVHHGAFGRAALYDLDKPILTHAHREAHLIFHISGGTARIAIDGEPCVIDAERAAAVSPWEPHNFELAAPGPACLCLVLYIKPLWFLEVSQSPELALRFGARQIHVTSDVSRWAMRLTSLLLDGESSAHFDGFLYETTRRCFDQSWSGAPRPSVIDTLRTRFTDYRVRRSLRLMQENFAEDVAIDWLAREAGLSRPHFFKLFRRQMGVTPNIYLNTLRAEQAIEDLMTTRKTVTDISFDLGFSSQASFTRFFASNVGIPPSEYRRVAHVC